MWECPLTQTLHWPGLCQQLMETCVHVRYRLVLAATNFSRASGFFQFWWNRGPILGFCFGVLLIGLRPVHDFAMTPGHAFPEAL